VRLGAHFFRDVGYRTSFAIILPEKRDTPLAMAEEAEPIPHYNLHPMANGISASDLTAVPVMIDP
jgi:hypothetical protein